MKQFKQKTELLVISNKKTIQVNLHTAIIATVYLI